MPETINAGEFPILSVFNDTYRFEIPPYQRPYAWTTDQAGELLDDILYATRDIRNMKGIEGASPYFMGSIVIIKKEGVPLAIIVDGQQRITTLTIMFCALRELAPENLRAVLNDYIRTTDRPFAGIQGHYRLTVRERDREFFQNSIQELGKLLEFVKQPLANLPDSQERMFENARHLWQRLSTLDAEQRNILAGFLVQRCYLVVVATSDQDSAYRIFAVMNDRGLDLSPTDILKARVIGPMNEDTQSKYTNSWEDIEEGVGRDGFRDIFSHIRMIYLKNKLRGTLQQEFQDGVLNRIDGANFIDEVLVPYADAYESITQASYESAVGADRVNVLLGYLNRLDNFDWIPPAMAFFKNNPHDTDTLTQFVQDLERLAYGLFLMRADVNRRITRYAEVLRSIEQGNDLYEDSSPLQLSSGEKTAILNALNGQIYAQNRVSRVGMPLLLRLDSLLADAGATYNPPVISIEHVLPRNPSDTSEWIVNFTDEQRSEWTGKLANLVLLSRRKNSQAQNYDFDRKKMEYFQRKGVAPFSLTTQVLNESKWTPKVLKRRQRELIDALSKEWRLA